MEKCVQCKRIKKNKDTWKIYFARFHEVEIQHHVCPQCSVLSFPKYYILYEDTKNNNGDTEKNFIDRNYLIAISKKIKELSDGMKYRISKRFSSSNFSDSR